MSDIGAITEYVILLLSSRNRPPSAGTFSVLRVRIRAFFCFWLIEISEEREPATTVIIVLLGSGSGFASSVRVIVPFPLPVEGDIWHQGSADVTLQSVLLVIVTVVW